SRSLVAAWVEAGGLKARQLRLRADREWSASANSNRRDDLADRFDGEVRLIACDRMTRLVGADENRRRRQPRNLLLRVQPRGRALLLSCCGSSVRCLKVASHRVRISSLAWRGGPRVRSPHSHRFPTANQTIRCGTHSSTHSGSTPSEPTSW